MTRLVDPASRFPTLRPKRLPDMRRAYAKQRHALKILILSELMTRIARRTYERGWLRETKLGYILQLVYRLGRIRLWLWHSGVKEERSAILRRHFPRKSIRVLSRADARK